LHELIVVVEVVGVLIVSTNVAVLSHPTEFVPTHVYVPDDV